METKFKIGDKVKIRKNLLPGEIYCSQNVSIKFTKEMDKYKGKRCKVISAGKSGYLLNIDHKENLWSPDMLEQEILDEVEKKYLSMVIRPFKKQVAFIKLGKRFVDNKVYVYIELKNNDFIGLPLFEQGTMYKGMELSRKYTLKELGLD